MAHAEQQLANYIPENVFPCPLLHHPHDHVRQNAAGIPLVAADGQREDHWEDIPPPIVNIGQVQRPHYIDRAHNLPPPAYPAIPYDLGVYDDVPLPVENMTIEDQAQPLHNVDEAHYNEIHPAPAHPGVPRAYDLGVNDYARPVQDVQAQAQVFGPPTPEIQGNGIFRYAPQRAEAGPYPAFPGDEPYQAPPGARRAESLQQLASRYLHHPNSQVDMVRMEQDLAGRPKVVIILDMDYFL
ncbi:hypothetical protein BJV78DRAFT_1363643 [Lactifluus subvellereus]|nr:hypothetical protein BJV78DRAFT_1363643 [Lactifluus subvellereus]